MGKIEAFGIGGRWIRSESDLPMKKILFALIALGSPTAADTGITIYNQNIAVIREDLPLNLVDGVLKVTFDQATAQVRPDSVVLRDPKGEVPFSILEQSYRNDPVSEGLLLQHFEGKMIIFKKISPGGEVKLIRGKVIRSGYRVRGRQSPIIEVDDSLQFTLPGQPIFPALGNDSILRPTLSWEIEANQTTALNAQLSYITGGFGWEATYNVVAPEKGETVSLNGWVTLKNQSGTGFTDANIKLVAGDVNVVQSAKPMASQRLGASRSKSNTSAIQEKAFDDFHLYTLPRKLKLRDQETKQVEFLRSDKLQAKKVYIYEPAARHRFYGYWNYGSMRGTEFPKEIHTSWEFDNSEKNGLGVPLPAGTVRFYRSDDTDGNLEFVGENKIPHTPKNEKVRVRTGTAFDLIGERTVTNFSASSDEKWVRESIKLTLKNRSEEEKTIIIREPLWRWNNWKLEKPSMKFTKVNSSTIEFAVTLAPDTTQDVSYVAFYSAEPIE